MAEAKARATAKAEAEAEKFELQVEGGGIPEPELWRAWEKTKVKSRKIAEKGISVIVSRALCEYLREYHGKKEPNPYQKEQKEDDGSQELLDELMKYVPLLQKEEYRGEKLFDVLMKYVPLLQAKVKANTDNRKSKSKKKREEDLEKYQHALEIFNQLVKNVKRFTPNGYYTEKYASEGKFNEKINSDGFEVIKKLSGLLEPLKKNITKMAQAGPFLRFQEDEAYRALMERVYYIDSEKFYTLIPGLPNPYFEMFEVFAKRERTKELTDFLLCYQEYERLVIESDNPQVPLQYFLDELWKKYINADRDDEAADRKDNAFHDPENYQLSRNL